MKDVKPIVLKYEDGIEYTLEFNREAVKKCEADGFLLSDLEDKLMTRLPQLFRWAFYMHHPTVNQQKADKILFEDIGGVNEALVERLVALYTVPYESLMGDGEQPKNSKLTVNL